MLKHVKRLCLDAIKYFYISRIIDSSGYATPDSGAAMVDSICCGPHPEKGPDYKPEASFLQNRAARLLLLFVADRVVWTFTALIVLVTLLDPDKIGEIFTFFVSSIAGIFPFLLLSVLMAALLKASHADRLIAKAFSVRPIHAVFLAAFVGALSPFCSCGVVPVIAGMLAAGVPLAPVAAFWFASPVMDPEMFILTAASISPEFAVAKTVAAIAIGIGGGLAAHLFSTREAFRNPFTGAVKCGGCNPQNSHTSGPDWHFWKSRENRKLFVEEMGATAWFLGKWLSIAFLIEGAMVAYIPMQTLGDRIASFGAFATPVASLIGVPSYLNGYAAIPLTGLLIDHGLSPGAALAFMIAGGVTSIPAAIAVKALVRMPVFLFYLAVALTGSIAIGYGYDFMLGLWGT